MAVRGGGLTTRRARRGAVAGLALALAAGCAAVPPPGPPRSNRGASLPDVSGQSYVLAAGDEIEVAFFRTPELNVRQLIRPDGGVSLLGMPDPAAREVRAADLTVHQFRDALVALYATELREPDIAVVVRTFGSNQVYVAGEVEKPGIVPLQGPMTALQAILAAQGIKSSARLQQVLVVRPVGGGRAAWRLLNLSKAFGAVNLSDDVQLAPHDIVYVPRSRIGDADEFVDLYVRRLLPVQPGLSLGR